MTNKTKSEQAPYAKYVEYGDQVRPVRWWRRLVWRTRYEVMWRVRYMALKVSGKEVICTLPRKDDV